MKKIPLETAQAVNEALNANKGWANGKNFPVDHLHATVAESRWEYENIRGIYLTNEQHTWMGLWMGICNRNVLRKRHITYMRPNSPVDNIGRIGLFATTAPEDSICDSAYLYLFDPSKFNDREIVDVRHVPKLHKVETLLTNGFVRKDTTRRGRQLPALVDATGIERVVLVDDWQIALTNFPDIVPDTELAIRRTAMAELAGRISILSSEVGEEYIQ